MQSEKSKVKLEGVLETRLVGEGEFWKSFFKKYEVYSMEVLGKKTWKFLIFHKNV